MGSGVPQWPAMDKLVILTQALSQLLYKLKFVFGCWQSHLDTGPAFHSRARWTYTLVPGSPPVYILCCRRKWPWLRTQSVFQSCCHLVESQGPHRRWLQCKNSIIHSSPIASKCNQQCICAFGGNRLIEFSFLFVLVRRVLCYFLNIKA